MTTNGSDTKSVAGWCLPAFDQHFDVYLEPAFKNNYQQLVFDICMKLTRNFRNVIDVGANIGLFTTRFSERFEQVHAFEPVDQNFRCLQANTRHLDNTTLHNLALGEENDILTIKLPANAKNAGAWSMVDFENYSKEAMLSRFKSSHWTT